MDRAEIEQALARASACLETGDQRGAFEAIEPLQQPAQDDPEAAAAVLALWRMAPGRAGLQQAVAALLERWHDDPTLVTRGCDALIRAAERTPPDEPIAEGGPGAAAAAAAERCLQALGDGVDPTLRGYLLINRANGLRLAREHDAALEAFEQALSADSERGGWWFNFGLLHKARRDFEAALAANRRARELLGDAHKGVLWNLAICGTATGQGEVAAEALRALGHDARVNERGMPVVEGLPPAQIRAATIGSGLGPQGQVPNEAVAFELLWVTPLSPVHGVISSASYRDASVDYGDVVLWDGLPVDVVEHEGRPLPRFPLLSVLAKGDEHRFRFIALQQQQGDVAALGEQLSHDARMFIHRETLETLSRDDSGGPPERRAIQAPEQHRLVYGKVVVPGSADLDAFRSAFEELGRKHPRVQIVMPGLLEAVKDSPAAGKAHQMWRGLERTGGKRGLTVLS
jgi:tetratricopeptide (TPR) repeat protein